MDNQLVQCFASWLSMCRVEIALLRIRVKISIVAVNVNVYSVISAQLCTWTTSLQKVDTSMHTQKPCGGRTIKLTTLCIYLLPIYLMASAYLSFLSDKQPEIHCTLYYQRTMK
jgi:hypothetical protein